MRKDIYKSKERYLNWRKRVKDGIPDISKTNSDLLKRYLNDMEMGINTGNCGIKGPRSYARLNTLRQRIAFFMNKTQETFNLTDITKLEEEQIHTILAMMRNGEIEKAITEMEKEGKPIPIFLFLCKKM